METINEPYIGPRPFEETDRDVFFGRTQEANELVSLITAHAAVLLYAQSGAGKTSLVRAGLIPLLVDEEKFNVIPPMRVRENIAAELKPKKVENVYMFNALSSIPTPNGVKGLASLSLTDYLSRCKETGPKTDLCAPTAIVFDQFEELFTLYPEHWEERGAFFMQVRDALTAYPLLRILFSMREDFIAELDPYVSFMPEKLRTRLRMESLREKTALGAVTEPLKRIQLTNGKRQFAPGVAEKLVNNLLQVKVRTPQGIKKVNGEFVEALQLQVVCQALWESLGDEDVITEEALEAYGDVDKALIHFYEDAIKNTVTRTLIKQGKLRQWFERTLITPTGTRGTVFRGEKETGGIPNDVIDELETQRIIRMELRGGAQWYELTHDRFVETVQTSNQRWLLSRPATEQIGSRLEERAGDWDHNDRQEKDLLDDVELSLAERWLASSNTAEIEPSRVLLAFVRASRQRSDTKTRERLEKEERLRQEARNAKLFQRLTLWISVVTIIGALALGVAGWLWWKQRQTSASLRQQTSALETANKDLLTKNEELEKKDRQIVVSTTLSQAYGLVNAGKLDDAEALFRSLLKGYEGSDLAAAARTHSSLGDIALKRGQHSTARTHYDKAVQILGKDEKFRNQLGQAFTKTAELYSDWAKRREEQGDLEGALKKYENSFGFYQKARDVFKKANNAVGITECSRGYLEAKKRFEDVREKLESQTISVP